jgi:hypothetical protein
MTSRWPAVLIAAWLLPAAPVHAQPAPFGLRTGEVYEIRTEREMSEEDSNGSTGSSTDRDVLIERVIAVRPTGVELEFDLPKSATAQEREPNWQFPVRIFKPLQGPMQLSNRADLEARRDAWLKAASLKPEACGHWYFTWNAFQVECDPEAVLQTLRAVDLRDADVREGASYQVPEALGPARLSRAAHGPALVATMTLDPEAVRRELAKSDVVVAELMKKPVTPEAALALRAKDAISGTITATFDLDPAGTVQRRTTVTVQEIKRPGGLIKTQTTTQTLELRRLPRGG